MWRRDRKGRECERGEMKKKEMCEKEFQGAKREKHKGVYIHIFRYGYRYRYTYMYIIVYVYICTHTHTYIHIQNMKVSVSSREYHPVVLAEIRPPGPSPNF